MSTPRIPIGSYPYTDTDDQLAELAARSSGICMSAARRLVAANKAKANEPYTGTPGKVPYDQKASVAKPSNGYDAPGPLARTIKIKVQDGGPVNQGGTPGIY